LDEVFDGADEFFNEKIANRIKSTIENSSAVIFISHSSSLIKEVCNRAIVLHNNKIAFDGSTQDGVALYKKINQSES
jgi:ABC-type polysaccharide/polyol phosphate transport system ATPase subunit